jgi:hypothetical protein
MNLTKGMGRRAIALAVVLLFGAGLRAAAPGDEFLGRWALTLPGGYPGWLEVKRENGWYDGAMLWRWGSVLPLASVTVADGVLTVTRLVEVQRKDATGKVVRTQQLTDTISARVAGDNLKLSHTMPREDGTGFDSADFSGHRIPALPPAPDLGKVHYGEPIALFNGANLAGWHLVESGVENGWTVEQGVLVNRPAESHETAPRDGIPHKDYGNLRTDREFTDFRLTLEVNVPAKSNSGVYLRGLYEIQVLDSFGQPLDSHNMGALYSRITPTVAAEKPAGEWQTLDITLVDRHVTVILNGRTIIDNQPVLGCTGGALTSDESKPGPIFLQGDHGAVSYRNFVLRPVVK